MKQNDEAVNDNSADYDAWASDAGNVRLLIPVKDWVNEVLVPPEKKMIFEDFRGSSVDSSYLLSPPRKG
jgi:hypothetical protein